ncbi:MAG: Trm112 family protein [Fidelibacterota bacterium]
MAISQNLLDILCCPETKENVHLIPEADVERINASIQSGTVRKRSGKPETEVIGGGLLREDGKYLYPIREDIPVMLIEEAIDMSTVD